MSYDILIADKYYMGDVLEGVITIEDSIDEIASRASFSLEVTPDFPSIKNAMDIKIIGIPYGESATSVIYQGIIWDINSNDTGNKVLPIEVYERTKYLDESEEEYLFKAGMTASDRFKKYSKDWDIPIESVPDTSIKLSQKIYRPQSIYRSMMADLKETALKGGKLFKPRMKGTKLDLIELGTNDPVWKLELLEYRGQKRSMTGMVTQVKILGAAKENKLSPVQAIKKTKTNEFGTIQKIISANDAEDLAEANRIAESMLTESFIETFTVQGLGINTIKSGDAVSIDGLSYDLIVMSVRNRLGKTDEMLLDLATYDHVRRVYYGR
jgi:hypothetical protein